jgi:hypothetical protein
MRPTLYTARQLEEPLTLAFEDGLRLLRHGRIDAEHGIMRFGSNYTFLVTVRLDELEALAIYKPRLGEAPLWDFLSGTLCQRELAAFYLSEALGWDLVPPTVLREDAPRGIGSLQLFIHHDPNCHYFRFEPRHLPQIQRFLAFDVVANNADRKGGHVLLDEADHIWGIDHGLCFNHVPKLRTVMWEFGPDDMPLAGTPLPEDVLADLRCLLAKLSQPDETLRLLMELLAEDEVAALRRRLTTLTHNGTYPLPRPSGSRPWPAV